MKKRASKKNVEDGDAAGDVVGSVADAGVAAETGKGAGLKDLTLSGMKGLSVSGAIRRVDTVSIEVEQLQLASDGDDTGGDTGNDGGGRRTARPRRPAASGGRGPGICSGSHTCAGFHANGDTGNEG